MAELDNSTTSTSNDRFEQGENTPTLLLYLVYLVVMTVDLGFCKTAFNCKYCLTAFSFCAEQCAVFIHTLPVVHTRSARGVISANRKSAL